MTALAPLVGWALFTSVCAVPVLKGTRMLAEWLEERPDGSISKGKSSNLVPLTASALAFGALAYGFGFGGIAGIAGGATTQSPAAFSAPSTPTIDVTVFAATGDSLFWLGSAFSADPGDTHDSTQLQIDTIGTNNWSGSTTYTDSVTTALERDTVPPVSNNGRALDSAAVMKARIRYYAREGGWSAWSDSLQFTMVPYGPPNTPTVDVVVFAATGDSLYWLGTPFVGEAGDTHQQTQVQIDSIGAAFGTNVFTDSTSSALERDTVPPVSNSGKALPAGAEMKARIRYKGLGDWSAWSDSATFTMSQTLETFSSPYMDVDFEVYETIAQMDTTTAVWDTFEAAYGCGTPPCAGGSGAYIDTVRGYNGRRHSLRYDFFVVDSTASQTIGRAFSFPANQTEIWLEFPIRYTTDFGTDPLGSLGSPGDHKLLFGGTQQGNTYRWSFKVGGDQNVSNNNKVKVERPGTTTNTVQNIPGITAQGAFWNDGEWHTVRIHWKHSVPGGTANGIQEYWIDGDSVFAETGFITATDGDVQDRITSLALGRNKDDGPSSKLISLWWGYMKVWTSDPGW